MTTLKRRSLLVIAVCAGSGLAHIPSSTMPFQIGAIIDGSHRSPSEAGLFGLFEISALALSMIAISPCIGRIPPRRIAMIGCLLSALANMGIFLFQEFHLQMALALVAGMGYGLVFAATIAGAANTDEPDRTYAIGNGGALLLIVGLMSVLPAAAARFGNLGIFVPLAAVALACTPFVFGFRPSTISVQAGLSTWRTPGAPGLLFAWATYSTGSGALYAFSERIGRSIFLNAAQIGAVLSVGVFVGVLGTIVAALLGKRANRKWALIIGMCGTGSSCLLLGFANNLTLFAAGVFTYWIFNMFLYSYLMGTAAVLDPAGRVGTLGGGLERMGYAVGAGVGGVLAEHTSYSATGVLGFFGCMLGLGIGFPSLFRALRHRAVESSATPALPTLSP
jgi:predicted MFS family arabinose efflux permease